MTTLAIANSATARRALLTTGTLSCLDGYMNVALEDTEEYAHGRLTAKYGDTFLRGNNGACGHDAADTSALHLGARGPVIPHV